MLHARPWAIPNNVSTEVEQLTRVLSSARRAAMADLLTDAAGAHGVVGVRFELTERDLGTCVWELTATGTAVSAPGPVPGVPFTSGLSGTDTWLLHRSGYAPVGLLAGVCVYHLAHRRAATAWLAGRDSEELPEFTEAMTMAREAALARMQAQVHSLAGGVDGVLDVRLVQRPSPFFPRAVAFQATGTAVRKVAEVVNPPTPVVLSLR